MVDCGLRSMILFFGRTSEERIHFGRGLASFRKNLAAFFERLESEVQLLAVILRDLRPNRSQLSLSVLDASDYRAQRFNFVALFWHFVSCKQHGRYQRCARLSIIRCGIPIS
jgi:hypothetical protein